MKILITSIITIASFQTFGADFSISQSRSSSSNSMRYGINQKITSSDRLGLSYNVTEDTSGTLSDNHADSIKLNFKHKFKDKSYYLLDVKKTNDSYFFTGQGLSAKYGFRFHEYLDSETNTNFASQLSFKYEINKKNYSLDNSESYTSKALTIGFDQDLPMGFNTGLSLTHYSYTQQGSESLKTFDNQTSTNSDISNHLLNIPKNAASFYIEYNNDNLSVGLSLTKDNPYLSLSGSSSSTTNEIYLDYQLLDSFSTNISYSSGQSETSTSKTETISLGLSLKAF